MSNILLVTGNQHKLQEWTRLMPPEITLNSVDLDLDELQSDDPYTIAVDKVHKAYAAVGKPVIVEDVSAGLDRLNGLPGPFIKHFIKRLGKDALYQLAGKKDGEPATASCIAAYYDGTNLHTAEGIVHGTIVSPRGNPFGFDGTFVPDGYEQTFTEMDAATKDAISHRAIAASKLLTTLRNHNLLAEHP